MHANTGNPLLRFSFRLALLLVLAQATFGQMEPGTQTPVLPPGVHVQISTTPQHVTVGDPVRLELEITMPPGCKAEIPQVEKQIGDFSVMEFYPGPAPPEAGNVEKRGAQSGAQQNAPVHHRARIVVAAYRTGTLTFPSVPILLRTADGKQSTISSPPLKIRIQSVLSEKDRDLKPLKRQAELQDRVRWELWLALLLVLGLLAALIWRLWKRRHRKSQSIPPVPPRDLLDLAEAELRELLADGFPSDEKVKSFYVRLSDIVKKILEAGFRIHTAERTTSEIMDTLRGEMAGKAEEMEQIESFLRSCDVVKFAKYTPTTGEHESAARDSLKILKISRALVASRQPPVLSGEPAVERRLPTDL
jgi:hypothetical protein